MRIFPMIAALVLAGCTLQSGSGYADQCRDEDDLRPWVLLDDPPANPEAYVALAVKSRGFGRRLGGSNIWLALDTGEITLCAVTSIGPGPASVRFFEFGPGLPLTIVKSGPSIVWFGH